jgi:hypothetical protein
MTVDLQNKFATYSENNERQRVVQVNHFRFCYIQSDGHFRQIEL